MGALARSRPVFHSEADFQLALASEIQQQHSDARIRLEKRVATQPRIELDIFVELDGYRHGLELKYARSKLEIEVAGELFALSTGAPDLDRYDVVRDLMRIERLVREGLIDSGGVLVLTNVTRIWSPAAPDRPTVYEAFRLDEERALSGMLDWSASTGEGTKIGRAQPVELTGTYELRWHDYCALGRTAFRYLLIPVPE